MPVLRTETINIYQIFIISIIFFQVAYASLNSTGCECINAKHTCGCCLLMDLPSIGLHDTGCVNMTYLPEQYGISVTLDIDGKVIINETISATHPPPVCAEVPYLKEYASVCLDFYDLSIKKSSFSGCVDLQARLVYVLTEKIHLGCWKLGQQFLKVDNSLESTLKLSEWMKTMKNIEAGSQIRKQKLKMLH